MPSSSTLPSPCPSSTDRGARRPGRAPAAAPVAALAALAAAGCGPGDDPVTCGPDDQPATGLTATGTDLDLVYDELTSSVNNDCSVPDAPISISIHGTSDSGLVTFCVPRPDLMADGPVPLGADRFQIIDLSATLPS